MCQPLHPDEFSKNNYHFKQADNYHFKHSDNSESKCYRSVAEKNDLHIWVLCLSAAHKEKPLESKWKKNSNLISALKLRRTMRVLQSDPSVFF